ncbi:hypothetical protein D3C78_1310480 [compost metagenome]
MVTEMTRYGRQRRFRACHHGIQGLAQALPTSHGNELEQQFWSRDDLSEQRLEPGTVGLLCGQMNPLTARGLNRPPLLTPVAQVMQQRIHTCKPHIAVGVQIGLGSKQRGGITPFTPAVLQVVQQGIDAGIADIGIDTQIGTGVEQAASHHLAALIHASQAADTNPA